MKPWLAILLVIGIPALWLGLTYHLQTKHKATTIEAAACAAFLVGLTIVGPIILLAIATA